LAAVAAYAVAVQRLPQTFDADAMMRFVGQISQQNQHLFASDWMTQVQEDLTALLRQPLPACEPGLTAQVIGTGPTVRYSAMPELFEILMYAARREDS
jgi:cardiolipin synthase